MAKGSDNNFPSVLVAEGTAPANPAASHQRLYIDSSDHKLKRVNSAGAVTSIEGTAGGGGWGYPQDFRLTLESGVPISTTDQANKTTLYMTPYKGNSIALYSGSVWNIRTSAEISIALGALTASKPYDVFCYDNSGTPTLEVLVWTDGTNRATALAYQDGVLVKSGATTRRYLGTIYIDSGQKCQDTVTQLFVWNYYHRVGRKLRRRESTSHVYNGAYRAWNNSTANMLEFIQGVAEDAFQCALRSTAYQSNGANAWELALNLDSFTVENAGGNVAYHSGNSTGSAETRHASAIITPQLGYHFLGVYEGGNATNSTYADYIATTLIPG